MTDDVVPAAKRFILLLIALAIGALALALAAEPRHEILPIALAGVLATLLAIAFRFPLPFAPNVQLHLDTAIIYAATLTLDPGVALLSVAAGTAAVSVSRRRPWWQDAFNASQATLQAAAACLALAASHWDPANPQFQDPGSLVGIGLAGAAMHAVNVLAIGVVVPLSRSEPVARGLFGGHMVMERAELLGHLALLGLGLLAAIIIDTQPWALALLLLPAVTVHAGLEQHVRLRRGVEARLAFLASHDPLTGLPNRRSFQEQTVQALARAGRRGTGVALLYLDLDSFKLANDTHGHHVGDALLVAAAQRLRAHLRLEDTVARRGGDEFTILLQDLDDPAAAERVAFRLIAAFAEPFVVESLQLSIGASIGLAYATGRPVEPETLLREADAALYQAKRRGGGTFAVADNLRRGRAA